MTIGDRIRLRRKELNLLQDDVAKRAGYTDRTAISKLEHAGNDISLKQVKRVADALDVDSAYLLGHTKTKTEIKDTYYKSIQYISQRIGVQMLEFFKGRRDFPVEELIPEFDVWQEEIEALRVLYNAYLKLKEREYDKEDM